MHLILRQIDADEPEEIEITGSLFAVGRYEQPFSEFDRSRVARLSKRHARIFEQDQGVYVADLESTNGTFVNGKPVRGEPKVLRDRDEVSFGGLTYRVLMLEQPAEPTSEAPIRLALTPEQNRSLLEPIVISRFPFLINKHSDAFARYKEALPDQLAFISRRHAHFFLKDGAVYIEDLGSTNGTFVSGRQLEEHAVQLEDGDTVALGGDQFVYRVHILQAAEEGTTELPDEIGEVDNADRTIFIDSPTSFVDIYVGSQEPEAEPDVSEEVEEEPRREPRSRAGRGLRLAGELKRSFFGDILLHPALKWSFAAMLLIALAAGGWYYWSGTDVRHISRDLARGNYLEAATSANDWLAEHPQDAEVRAMATEALLKYLVPEWIAHIKLRAFDDADALLTRARALGADNPDDDGMLDILAWHTRAARYLATRAGSGDLNRVLSEGATPGELVDWWEADSRGHARELLELTDLVGEFRPVREQIYSDVRQLHALRREQRPIQSFLESLDAALEAKDMAAARQAIDQFHDESDLDPARALDRDAERLAEILALIDGQQWLDAYAKLERTEFLTVPFAEHAREMTGRDVPDADTAARFRDAQAAWRSGDAERALALLDSLADGRWGADARELDAHYRSLLADRAALSASRGEPGYDERLFGFYGALDPDRDRFLADELRPELDSAAGRIRERLQAHLAEADRAWRRYQALGGIQVEERVEDRVSGAFTELTGSLGSAKAAVEQAGRMYSWLNQPPTAEWQGLRSVVCREIAQQRGLVVGLTLLSTDVREQKLELIPQKCAEQDDH